MHTKLTDRSRSWRSIAARSCLLAGVFTCIYFVARRGIGAWYFQKKTPEAMQAAIFWDPQNAQYYDALATLRHFYAEDRKSTRLNSSHSQISYAVFCLKKKKNNK